MLSLLMRYSDRSPRAIVWLVAITGISSGLLLAVINSATETAVNGEVHLRMFMLFGATLALFVFTKRDALDRASAAAERAIRDIRIDLSNKLRHSELLLLEDIGREDIFARLTQDTSLISQSMPTVFNGLQAGVIVLAGMFYLATLSATAFVLTVGFVGFGAMLYRSQSKLFLREYEENTVKENVFFETLGHLIDGFKEVKINHAKNNDVYGVVKKVADESEVLMRRVSRRFSAYLVVSQLLIYLLIALLVFGLPALECSESRTLLKLVTAVLFIVGPLEMLFNAWYTLGRAEVAVANIVRLRQRLEGAVDQVDVNPVVEPERWAGFQKIEFRDVVFRYPNGGSFQLGPLNLTIERNTITFLVGANGCGKSTTLKVLTGLYHPESGSIVVDGHVVEREEFPSYRELFGCIFGDFHLFDRLYGLTDVDPEDVRRQIEEMGLSRVTAYEKGRFTKTKLSTGQRKRLGMVAARLENKPIYVFDEWAAEQDPEFRAYFYEVILPDLRAKGRTVIAVTHDDRYFDACDRVVKLDWGRAVSPGAASAASSGD